MSKQHGDKARFHRIRKQNTARRLKSRELQSEIQKRLALAAIPLVAVLPIVPVVN
jgi:hypothetical protein